VEIAMRGKVAPVIREIVADGLPVALEAFDGSSAGPVDAVCRIRINSPLALNYVATAPNGLGLARAYVSGCLTLRGTSSRR
jgi:cyclopropane-fatty-acyl-phospholipid synthase